MSRSRKKPYDCYVCYFSNKKDKQIANRKFRRINKIYVKVNPDKLKYHLKEVSDTYDFASDGLASWMGDNPRFYFITKDGKKYIRK
jgi:hypothetical protein